MQQDGNLFLSVIDDGKGFSMGTLPGGRKTLGLLSMKERTLMMGGQFRIDSAPGHGTTVTVSIPKTIIG
jgi:signal transduction histidine kinase